MNDGRGTPGRSRAFRNSGEGVLDGSGQADHVAAIKRLGERYPFLDLERWGITGYSGGGYGSTRAILRYPDVYKVAVSGAGSHNHWQTGLSDGEVFLGSRLTILKAGRCSRTRHWQRTCAASCCHPGWNGRGRAPGKHAASRHALIEAGKRFDLLIVPRANHGRLWRDP